MNLPPEILEKLPAVKDWISQTLGRYRKQAKPAAAYGFPNLPKYFSKEILEGANVVETEKLPILPVSEFGLSGQPNLTGFEKGDYSAVTLMDTYFILPQAVASEATHCHELIHILQWKYLGAEKFIMLYALGLLAQGYRESPLEKMAYQYQEMFLKGLPYEAEAAVSSELKRF